MRIVSRVLMLAALAAGLQGCVQSVKPNPNPAPIQMDSVVVIDKSLQDKIVIRPFGNQARDYNKILVEEAGTARTATGTLEVWVMLRNLTDHPLTLRAHTRFFDDNRRPLEEYSSWQQVQIAPKGSATYKELSTSQAATRYYIEVQEN